MKIDPNRFNELAGAARAAEMTHQQQKADAYYAQLLKNCDDGKYSDRPALQRAKTVTAKERTVVSTTKAERAVRNDGP